MNRPMRVSLIPSSGSAHVGILRTALFTALALACGSSAVMAQPIPTLAPPAASAQSGASSQSSPQLQAPLGQPMASPQQNLPPAAAAPPSQPVLGQNRPIPGDAYWTNRSGGFGASRSLESGPSSVNEVMADSLLKDASKTSIDPIRAQQIQEAAAAYGAQAAMDARARDINRVVLDRSKRYDSAFNFSAIMLEPGFLPPVISEGRDAYNQPGPNTVRAADRLYRIEFPARLVSVPPTWRDYLPIEVTGAPRPDASVLPKNRDEKNLWDQAAAEGWKRGVELANETFEANLARLQRDFQGMLRFKQLYQQGAVSKPQLARSTIGVTGGGDEMAVNDRIYQITQKAQLDPAQGRWSRAVPVTANPDLQRPDVSGKDLGRPEKAGPSAAERSDAASEGWQRPVR